MDCATAREAISAMADGEDPGTDGGDVEAHLAGCAACRAWRDAAHEVTRRARLGVARPVPVRVREVAAVARSRARVPRRASLATLARVSLVAVAMGQLAFTVPCLLFGHDHSAPAHIAHEMGSFDAALAAGFLVAAWRPRRALGMRALVGVAAALLVVTAVIDLAAGRTSVGDEAPHLLAVAGWLMICYLASVTPPTAAKARPVLPARLRSRLPAPLARTTRFPVATAPAGHAPQWRPAHPPLRGDHHHLADGPAACGCVAARCSCPGCAAPGHVAAG
jgi:predicted anti-sigma-YlaC factor YlaD